MTNKERQNSLDKKKWLLSEENKGDMSGLMSYCDFCNYQVNGCNCYMTYEDIHKDNICAKAYNRMVRNGVHS